METGMMGTLAEFGGIRRSIQLAPEAAAATARQRGICVVARTPRQHGKGRIPHGLSIIVKAGERPRGVERICVHWDSGSPSPDCVVVERGVLLPAWIRSSSGCIWVGRFESERKRGRGIGKMSSREWVDLGNRGRRVVMAVERSSLLSYFDATQRQTKPDRNKSSFGSLVHVAVSS